MIKHREGDIALDFISLANAMPQLVWISLADGVTIYYNDRLADYAGTKKKEDGSWIWDNPVHPDDLHRTIATWENSVKTGRHFEIEHRLQMENGEYRWHLNRATPQYDESGNIKFWFGTATDVHKHKQIENALRASEAEFRASFENSSVGMAQTNTATGQFLRVNDAFCNMIGYSREELMETKFSEITHPEERDADLILFRKMVNGETREYQSEKRYVRKDGSVIWVMVTSNLVYGEDGKATRTNAVIRDITRKKNAEYALLDSEEKFKAFLHNSPLLAWSKDEQGKYVYINLSYEKRWGVSLEDWKGKTDMELHTVEIAKQFRDNDLKVLRTSEPIWDVEQQIELDGSTSYWQSFKFTYTDVGGQRFVGGIGYEITKQRIAEEASRKAKEQLELTFTNVPTGIMLFDKSRKLVFANDLAANFTGYNSAQEMMNAVTLADVRERGSTHYDVYNDEGSLEKPENSPVQRSFKTMQATYGVYKLNYKNDNSIKWVYYVSNPLVNEKGEVDMVIATITDITIQKEAENLLMKEQRDSAERLERLVDQRTRELQESNEGLQQFAHVASHDLKEPVRKIKIFGNRLREEYGDVLPERARLYLEKMEAAANRMYTMIEGVLQYSSFNSLQQEIEPIDLGQMMKSIESDLEILIHQKQAEVVYKLLPVIKGVPVLIHQLFYNLINNSLKFSKAGLPPVIKISSGMITLDNQEFVRIDVEDNGIGFEEEYADRIFHTFSRLHPKDIYEGTGLGLSLCKKIVERHQGFIEAKSEIGKGSRFSVMLPVSPTTVASPF